MSLVGSTEHSFWSSQTKNTGDQVWGGRLAALPFGGSGTRIWDPQADVTAVGMALAVGAFGATQAANPKGGGSIGVLFG